MSHRRYQKVLPRGSVQLPPPCLDDFVGPNNPFQAIDAFVKTLDVRAMGFDHTENRSGSGQPPFNTAMILNLYIYGYQNKVRSSRGLEKATRTYMKAIRQCQEATYAHVVNDQRFTAP